MQLAHIEEVWSEHDSQRKKYPPEHDNQYGLEHLLAVVATYVGGAVNPAVKKVEPREAIVKATATLFSALEWMDSHT